MISVLGNFRTPDFSQSLALFPDSTVVSASFGVYVADDVQKIQMVLIGNCRDETTTRHGVQRLFDWLEQTGDVARLARRAHSKTKIIKAIYAEYAARAETAANSVATKRATKKGPWRA